MLGFAWGKPDMLAGSDQWPAISDYYKATHSSSQYRDRIAVRIAR